LCVAHDGWPCALWTGKRKRHDSWNGNRNTGAVVANANVEITNTATGVSQKTLTNAAGDYTVPYLNPAVYRVTVSLSGFGNQVVNNITLVVAQQNRVDVTLKPGAIAETVTVNSGAVALDTDTSSVSQLVSQKQVDQLPLNGGTSESAFHRSGGGANSWRAGQMRQGEGNAISINGARPESNNYTLDGMANTDTALSTPAVISLAGCDSGVQGPERDLFR